MQNTANFAEYHAKIYSACLRMSRVREKVVENTLPGLRLWVQGLPVQHLRRLQNTPADAQVAAFFRFSTVFFVDKPFACYYNSVVKMA